ncbi:MAG: DRTGG domain-containing protein [Chloroflexota bacterium]|nr:DRTGG domain-containing protein [Chloroflexota bacterium]MDE2884085.1 DRTGG domain-containing protein [Chloroflexota bacterium]
MSVVQIVGAGPGVGATTVACGLASLLRSQDRRVALVKPLSSPGDADPAFLASLGGSPETVSVDGAPSPEQVAQAAQIVQGAAANADVVVVEGPYLSEGTAAPAELARATGAVVIGVLEYERSLGADACGPLRDAFGDSLAGCVVNKRTRYAGYDASARLAVELAEGGMPVLGMLPEERLLLAPTVQQVAEHLGGTYFAGEDGGGELIEHFLIGGLITEWGGNYFGRLPNQAVVVRGGRIDIQMSALNFPLNALFLTGCETPSQYVYQRAEELDVPLIAVGSNTHETAEALESLSAAVSVHHTAKAARAGAMALECVDASALSAALGG